VPLWLLSRHTHTDSTVTSLCDKLSQLS